MPNDTLQRTRKKTILSRKRLLLPPPPQPIIYGTVAMWLVGRNVPAKHLRKKISMLMDLKTDKKVLALSDYLLLSLRT